MYLLDEQQLYEIKLAIESDETMITDTDWMIDRICSAVNLATGKQIAQKLREIMSEPESDGSGDGRQYYIILKESLDEFLKEVS